MGSYERGSNSTTYQRLTIGSVPYQRQNDGSGYRYALPTPGQENVFQADEVVISEVAVKRAEGYCTAVGSDDWIEIKNLGPSTIHIDGYVLSNGSTNYTLFRGYGPDFNQGRSYTYCGVSIPNPDRTTYTFAIADGTDTISLSNPDGDLVCTTGKLPGRGSISQWSPSTVPVFD
jgi:hypothetical protein